VTKEFSQKKFLYFGEVPNKKQDEKISSRLLRKERYATWTT